MAEKHRFQVEKLLTNFTRTFQLLVAVFPMVCFGVTGGPSLIKDNSYMHSQLDVAEVLEVVDCLNGETPEGRFPPMTDGHDIVWQRFPVNTERLKILIFIFPTLMSILEIYFDNKLIFKEGIIGEEIRFPSYGWFLIPIPKEPNKGVIYTRTYSNTKLLGIPHRIEIGEGMPC